jgi:hypothetical protein
MFRLTASLLAAALFVATLVVSAHGHPGSSSGEIHACSTCQLLPQGVQFLQKQAAVQLIASDFCTEIQSHFSPPLLSQKISHQSIRGPPSA